MNATRAVAQRVGYMLLVVIGVTALTQYLFSRVPGGPAYAILGEQATPEAVAALNAKYGLDDPVVTRYWHWVDGLFHGSLGTSVKFDRPVLDLILQRVPVTLELAGLATAVGVLVSVALSLACARRPGGILDRIVTAVCSIVMSVPGFLVALTMVYVFAVQLKVFPILGWVPLSQDPAQNMRYATLPVLSLAILEIAEYVRVLRGDLVNTLSEEFIAVARSTGVPTRTVLLRYALRPSSTTALALAGLNFGRLLGGTVIVETIYSLPGLGRLAVEAITSRDLVLVQGIVVFVAVVFVVVNTLVDLVQAALDPRVRQPVR